MIPDVRGVTLLWALRSPCQLACQYCYFGTLEAGATSPRRVGELSHVGSDDASLESQLGFIDGFSPGLVKRVFIAGGEPLLAPGVLKIIDALAQSGVEVVVSTNGQPLRDAELTSRLVAVPLAAISVSLDSHDASYNDRWRTDHSGQGWRATVKGLETALEQRQRVRSMTQIGVYSVITRQNISHITDTARFVADLGVDYFIVQPISLAPDHKLHSKLSIGPDDLGSFREAIGHLQSQALRIMLPNSHYVEKVFLSLSPKPQRQIPHCFGGRDLFFIQPDGSVWDCPSRYKIADTRLAQRASILETSARALFSAERRARNTDCDMFSEDCVNMWQLMAFDEIVAPVWSVDTPS